jgi:hypothetical protein
MAEPAPQPANALGGKRLLVVEGDCLIVVHGMRGGAGCGMAPRSYADVLRCEELYDGEMLVRTLARRVTP